jgi:acetyl-CoA C-acetyltransferase
MNDAWIIDAVRTPRGIGKLGKGALADVHPQKLLSAVLRALARRNSLRTSDIDDVIAGCGTQVGKRGACIARMAALDAGFDEGAAGFSLDRFCGSGLADQSPSNTHSDLNWLIPPAVVALDRAPTLV